MPRDTSFDDRPTYEPSIDECARTGRPFVDLPYDSDKALRTILSFFAIKYTAAISVPRLVQLTFYIDYRYYQLHGEQLTDARYKYYGNGMSSKDIKREVENSPYEDAVQHEFGNTVPAIKTDADLPDTIDDDLEAFLEQMLEETRKVSTEDLAEFCDNTPAAEHTRHDEYVKFNDRTVQSLDDYEV